MVTASLARAEDNKETRYGKNRRDDYQSSGGMNPRQQSVPRRHIPEGLDGRKKNGVGAEAARPRAHFMACKRSQFNSCLPASDMNAPPSVQTLCSLAGWDIRQMSSSASG
jgi:hypothetical protein